MLPEAEATTAHDVSRAASAGRWDAILAVLALALIAGLFLAAPGSLLDKADRAAYAVCHRIAGHSFVVAGRQLPLCARCSGTYLGALAGFTVLALRGRGRAGRLPGKKYLAVLAGFVALWAVDGANSYLTLLPGLSPLYQPHNLLRLASGTLEGLAIAALLLPVVNLSLWRDARPEPSIANWRDVAWLLAGAALVVALVSSEADFLLYPLALLSGLMILLMVGIVNALGLLLVLRRDGRAVSWPAVAGPLLAGLALGVVELAAIGLGRDLLTQALGLPF